MVKFNLWELKGYFGKRPKSFKRDANKQLEGNTLGYLQKFGRGRWISVPEIFEETLEQTDLFKSEEGKMFFAVAGIKGKIHGTTSKLRREGYPIVSGVGNKGYRYADEKCVDYIDVWDETLSGLEQRKSRIAKEAKAYEEIIKKIIERLRKKKREEEAKKLEKVLVKISKNEN